MTRIADDKRTALVLGATGGVGSATARALLARGWRVRAMSRSRSGESGVPLIGAEWVKGDALVPAEVLAAAQGAAVIVHAVNPPGYRNWPTLVPAMLESAIAAAEATGARLVLPGTVYNFGPDAGGTVREDTPQTPHTRKGRIRVAMERRLRESGVKTLIVRAGDFFGPGATANSWFAQLVKPGNPVEAVHYPGRREVGHAWAFLPDLGETIAALVDREAELARFERFNFGGHWFPRGVEMAEAVRRVAGRPEAPIRPFAWPMLIALSPFMPMFREILEMRWLWERPLRLDNSRLVAFLGAEPHTPTDQAVETALRVLGCLETERQAIAA